MAVAGAGLDHRHRRLLHDRPDQTGAAARDEQVDQAARRSLEADGFGPGYKLPGLTHRTGHGIGLEVHEGPSASRVGTGELAEDMTLTIEPGIYVPGKGGVRIEDTLIITDGAPKIITAATKEFTELPA